MSKKFTKKWESSGRRIIRKGKPLKFHLNYAVNRLEQQIQRINSYINRYEERDRELFERIVKAYENRDNKHANMLANELSEVRRQRNLLMNAKLALDNVSLRLRTILEFGNFVSAVSPVIDALQSIRSSVSGILPEVGSELSNIGIELNDLVVEMGQSTGAEFDFSVGSEDAKKILEEAAVVAENRTKMRLPDLADGDLQTEGSLISRDDGKDMR